MNRGARRPQVENPEICRRAPSRGPSYVDMCSIVNISACSIDKIFDFRVLRLVGKVKWANTTRAYMRICTRVNMCACEWVGCGDRIFDFREFWSWDGMESLIRSGKNIVFANGPCTRNCQYSTFRVPSYVSNVTMSCTEHRRFLSFSGLTPMPRHPVNSDAT